MSTQAKPGIGAALYRWNEEGTSGAWVEITEVTALSWPGATRNVIETFRLNNSDDYVNKLQGVLNASNITATINYTRDEFMELRQHQETRGNKNYQIRLPDGEALEWEGFITELPIDPIGSDDVMQGDVVFEIDGRPDFVSAPGEP